MKKMVCFCTFAATLALNLQSQQVCALPPGALYDIEPERAKLPAEEVCTPSIWGSVPKSLKKVLMQTAFYPATQDTPFLFQLAETWHEGYLYREVVRLVQCKDEKLVELRYAVYKEKAPEPLPFFESQPQNLQKRMVELNGQKREHIQKLDQKGLSETEKENIWTEIKRIELDQEEIRLNQCGVGAQARGSLEKHADPINNFLEKRQECDKDELKGLDSQKQKLSQELKKEREKRRKIEFDYLQRKLSGKKPRVLVQHVYFTREGLESGVLSGEVAATKVSGEGSVVKNLKAALKAKKESTLNKAVCMLPGLEKPFNVLSLSGKKTAHEGLHAALSAARQRVLDF